jgi:WD40 repeat protein
VDFDLISPYSHPAIPNSYSLFSGTLIDTLQGHAKPVSALAFRLKTHQLFSGSHDRCLKHWNVDDMGYVESLYGHGTEVNSIDVLHKEKVVRSTAFHCISVNFAPLFLTLRKNDIPYQHGFSLLDLANIACLRPQFWTRPVGAPVEARDRLAAGIQRAQEFYRLCSLHE